MRLIAIVAFLSLAVSAHASHFIQDVKKSGEILVLDDGTAWRVDATDTVTSSLWLTTDEVVVTDDGKIVHVANKEAVDAHQINLGDVDPDDLED